MTRTPLPPRIWKEHPMTPNLAGKSVLLITPDTDVSKAIERALSSVDGVKLRTLSTTLSALNGKAAQLAGDKDLIIFDTAADAGPDIEAIRALAIARRAGARLLALGDAQMTLAHVHALNSVGVDAVLPAPQAGQDTAEIAQQLEQLGRQSAAGLADAAPRGRLVAVAQARGGVGATTVAVNLANELVGKPGGLLRKAQTRPVALVDLDLQFGSVGALLDLGEKDALHQMALEGVIPDADYLARMLVKMPNGLSVLPAPSKFMPLDSLSSEQIATILDLLRRENDYVVVDLPHALGTWIEPVLKRADELLIVSDTSVPSIRHCRRLIDFFTQDNPDLPVRIIINREKRSLFGSAVQKEAQKALNRKLDHWLPLDAKAARASVDRGKPLASVAPRSTLGKAIQRLARDTVQTLPASATQTVPHIFQSRRS